MISCIEGELLAMSDGKAMLACGCITYELFVPGADVQRLATEVGQSVRFHTLHYLEAQGPTGPFIPRLIGFATPEDREFFNLFTTVKGMGNRKALRALQLPFADVAAAIAQEDVDVLVSLPEIGKRTAQTIVAELKGKVDHFASEWAGCSGTGGGASAVIEGKAAIVHDAAAVLVQLGEARMIARQLIDRALAADPQLNSAEDLVAAAFRLKQLG